MKPLKATVYIETELSPSEGEHPRFVVQKELERISKHSHLSVILDE